jgi:hypothetical protein
MYSLATCMSGKEEDQNPRAMALWREHQRLM